MNNWGTHREVEKTPKTKYVRHQTLRAEAIALTTQLSRLSAALTVTERHDAPIRGYVMASEKLIVALVAELMTPK